jgi:hypothetical protein
MPSTTAQGRRAPGRPLKSPLAMAGDYAGPRGIAPEAQTTPALEGVVLSEREATLAEFKDYLRTVNNRDGRPYEEKTISAYVAPGKHLDKWLTSQGIGGDFTAADTTLLNKYFRQYYRDPARHAG